MENKETSSAIIGFRVEPRVKEKLKETADKRRQTLSDFIWELIGAGWDIVVKHKIGEEPGEKGQCGS